MKKYLITEKSIERFISTMKPLFETTQDFIDELNSTIAGLNIYPELNSFPIKYYEKVIQRIKHSEKVAKVK